MHSTKDQPNPTKIKYYDGPKTRNNLDTTPTRDVMADRLDHRQTNSINPSTTAAYTPLQSYQHIGANRASMCRTKYDIDQYTPTYQLNGGAPNGGASNGGALNDGAPNKQGTLPTSQDNIQQSPQYIPHGCNICPDKGIGDINVLNDLRSGQDSRMEGYLYGEYVNDLFLDIERSNIFINTDTLPFPRGGLSTRKLNRTPSNNI